MKQRVTIETLYKFDELSDDAKQKAVENLWDINVDYDWWQFTYDAIVEAGQAIGIDSVNIEGFDLDRAQSLYIKSDTVHLKDLIVSSEKWETLKTEWPGLYEGMNLGYYSEQINGLNKWLCKVAGDTDTVYADYYLIRAYGWDSGVDYSNDLYGYTNLYNEAETAGALLEEFLQDFKNYAFGMLRDSYECLTSEEAIIETIQANEYDFTEDGELA